MRPLPLALAVSLGALALAGCASSQSARIQEKATVFQSLTPKQQKQIRAHQVKVGFTPDMVYLSLGSPSSVRTVADAKTPVEEWRYERYVPDPGTDGFENRDLTSDLKSGDHQGSDRYAPQQVPLTHDVCTLVLQFRDGHVVTIRTT